MGRFGRIHRVNPHSPRDPLDELGAGGHREDTCVLSLHLCSRPGPMNLRGAAGGRHSRGAQRGTSDGVGSEMGALHPCPREEPSSLSTAGEPPKLRGDVRASSPPPFLFPLKGPCPPARVYRGDHNETEGLP